MAIKKVTTGWQTDIQPGGRGAKRLRKTFRTKPEALQWETWVKAKLQEEPEWTPVRRETKKLSEVIELWWDHVGINMKSGAGTRSSLEYMCELLGNPVADRFDARMFAVYRKDRLAAGLAANSINREHAYCRAMFNELRRLKLWTRDNPLAEVRQLKIEEPELTYMTSEQIMQLLKTLSEGRNLDALLVTKICLATGARWSESEMLRRSQVRAGAIHLTSTKNGKNRSIPIPKGLERELENWHGRHGLGDRMFRSCYAAFRNAIERAGIELPEGQLTHVLRHTFASHFMMNGGNILVLQRILGHQSLTMTMRYAHLAPDHLQEARKLNPLTQLTLC